MRDFILSSNPMAVYAVLDGAEPIEGDMIAVDSDSEALPAADTAGLTVAGVCVRVITDDDDDSKSVEVRDGIFPFANSETNPLTRADRNSLVYVEDKDTVSAGAGTNGIVAGVLVDVYDDYVYVDNRPASIAAAVGNKQAVLVTPTYSAPSDGDTVDTEGRAATAQNAVDIAAIITALQNAGMMASE